jgi:hypothetical protein
MTSTYLSDFPDVADVGGVDTEGDNVGGCGGETRPPVGYDLGSCPGPLDADEPAPRGRPGGEWRAAGGRVVCHG